MPRKTTHAVCPVDALVQYLVIQGGTSGPLFLVSPNQSLTRALFSAQKSSLRVTHEISPV